MSFPTRSSMPDRRTMARCLCVVAAIASLAATRPANPGGYAPFPTPDSGYVTDLAHVLTRDQEEEIEQWLWRVEERTGVEMAVVTINSISDYPGTPNESIEKFATALFDRWGIGNRPKDDGVLLLVAVGDRKARIELGAGHGHARDRAASAIMEGVIVPRFRKEDYRGGLREGVLALMLEFAHVRVGWNWPLIVLTTAIPVIALTAVSLFRHGKRGWGWVFVGLGLVAVLAVIWVIRVFRQSDGDSSSWSAGGFGGGFGGGSSGGGGASGSW